jgi:hypothetical protein
MDAMNSTCCLVGLLWLQHTYNLGSVTYIYVILYLLKNIYIILHITLLTCFLYLLLLNKTSNKPEQFARFLYYFLVSSKRI